MRQHTEPRPDDADEEDVGGMFWTFLPAVLALIGSVVFGLSSLVAWLQGGLRFHPTFVLLLGSTHVLAFVAGHASGHAEATRGLTRRPKPAEKTN